MSALLLLGIVHAEQVWVSPSVSLEEATEAVSRLGITDAPQPLSALTDRFSLAVFPLQRTVCPSETGVAALRASLAEAQVWLQRLNIPAAIDLVVQISDDLVCLSQPAPPDLLFSVPLVSAELRAYAMQAEPAPRHQTALSAALYAAATLDGTPPISLDPALSRELIRIRRSMETGMVRAFSEDREIYLDGQRLSDEPAVVREGRHLVQMALHGGVLHSREIDVEEGAAILLWASSSGAPSDWQIIDGVEALERTGQAHMMLGPALSTSGPEPSLLVTRSTDGLVVWGTDGDQLHQRLQLRLPEPETKPESKTILPDHPYGIRFVGLAGQWLGETGLGGGLTGWVAFSERGRLSLSLAAASAMSSWSSTGQTGGLLPMTVGVRRRGLVWEVGAEAGGAYTIRLGDDPFRPMAGLVGAISLPPTTAAAAHLQVSGGWIEGGGWGTVSVGIGLR
ncbi:MAG: hypothetical protein ACI8RZ_006978 [Myxococcota bacterium]